MQRRITEKERLQNQIADDLACLKKHKRYTDEDWLNAFFERIFHVCKHAIPESSQFKELTFRFGIAQFILKQDEIAIPYHYQKYPTLTLDNVKTQLDGLHQQLARLNHPTIQNIVRLLDLKKEAVQTALEKKLFSEAPLKNQMIYELKQYIQKRTAEAQTPTGTSRPLEKSFHSFFGRLFSYSAATKIQAATNIIHRLSGAAGDEYALSFNELSALQEGRLGGIINKYKKQGLTFKLTKNFDERMWLGRRQA